MARPGLLIVDVINDLDFPEATQLARFIPNMTEAGPTEAVGIPVVYVNDRKEEEWPR
jgi:hypothetical protein